MVDFNDEIALEEYLKKDPNCVAVFLEPIQAEGGTNMPKPGYLKKVYDLCKKYNCLLIFDEVQTGLARSGKLMCYEYDLGDLKPDIVCLAKALSGGFYPVSGIVAKKDVIECLEVGTHGSTFQGTPLGMAIAKAALEVIVEEKLAENAYNMGELWQAGLESIDSPMVDNVRGRGLIRTVTIRDDLRVNGHDFCRMLLNHKFITKATRDYHCRFTPPLVYTKDEIHSVVEIYRKALKDLEKLNDSRK